MLQVVPGTHRFLPIKTVCYWTNFKLVYQGKQIICGRGGFFNLLQLLQVGLCVIIYTVGGKSTVQYVFFSFHYTALSDMIHKWLLCWGESSKRLMRLATSSRHTFSTSSLVLSCSLCVAWLIYLFNTGFPLESWTVHSTSTDPTPLLHSLSFRIASQWDLSHWISFESFWCRCEASSLLLTCFFSAAISSICVDHIWPYFFFSL